MENLITFSLWIVALMTLSASADIAREEVSRKYFGDLFDLNIKKEADAEVKPIDECVRLYIVEKNFIDAALYEVTLPENAENFDCNGFIKNLERQFYETKKQDYKTELGWSGAKLGCAVRRARHGHYFGRFWAVKMLSQLNLSDEQKVLERKHFVDTMTDVDSKIQARCANDERRAT